MKTELRIGDHHFVRPGAKVFEIWHDGEMIGEVVGADGPGVRVITKHEMSVGNETDTVGLSVAEVRIRKRGL
jgi:hypothetical protein